MDTKRRRRRRLSRLYSRKHFKKAPGRNGGEDMSKSVRDGEEGGTRWSGIKNEGTVTNGNEVGVVEELYQLEGWNSESSTERNTPHCKSCGVNQGGAIPSWMCLPLAILVQTWLVLPSATIISANFRAIANSVMAAGQAPASHLAQADGNLPLATVGSNLSFLYRSRASSCTMSEVTPSHVLFSS
jgi:hypothetical protein